MEEITKQDEVEIDLKEIITLIIQNALVIILASLCIAIILYTNGKSKSSTTYTSTTKMYILTRNVLDDTVNGDSQFVTSVLQDYQALVTSEEILEEVNRKLELGSSYQALASQIFANVPADGKMVSLTVMDVNPITSMKIANTLRDVMAQYLKNTMNIKLFDVVEEAMVGTPTTVDKAKRNAVLGGFVMACLLMGIIAMRYLIDDSIKSPEEIETKLGLSVLSTIPFSHNKGQKKVKSIFRQKKARKSIKKNTNAEIEHLESEGDTI